MGVLTPGKIKWDTVDALGSRRFEEKAAVAAIISAICSELIDIGPP